MMIAFDYKDKDVEASSEVTDVLWRTIDNIYFKTKRCSAKIFVYCTTDGLYTSWIISSKLCPFCYPSLLQGWLHHIFSDSFAYYGLQYQIAIIVNLEGRSLLFLSSLWSFSKVCKFSMAINQTSVKFDYKVTAHVRLVWRTEIRFFSPIPHASIMQSRPDLLLLFSGERELVHVVQVHFYAQYSVIEFLNCISTFFLRFRHASIIGLGFFL